MSDQSPHAVIDEQPRRGPGRPPSQPATPIKILDALAENNSFRGMALELMTLSGVRKMNLEYDKFKVTIEMSS